MNTHYKTLALLAAAFVAVAGNAEAKSVKRGIGWDEKTCAVSANHVALMSPGVSWLYNWGPDAANSAIFSADLRFEPMAWNSGYDRNRITTWLKNHPECHYLLGFNEPNFADQARMTPAQAASAWPGLEAIATEYNVALVAPALNFSNSQVGGRTWNPYEWYDEFFRLRPDARVDFLAMHCYMNWYSAHTWLATEYFYADLYNSKKDCYGKYPNLVAFLDKYKTANGHFPRMIISEFCSWENDGTIKNVDFQIDQMTQKVQKMEQSDLVEAYAWFIGNSAQGASGYPYMSIIERNNANSGLSNLGKVYVYMSDFDTSKYYTPGQTVAAKDYVDATTDDQIVKVRPNTETSSDIPLQIEIPSSGYPVYQIDVPATGEYEFTFRLKAPKSTQLWLYVDNKKNVTTTVNSADWTDAKVKSKLTAGQHRIMVYNAGSEPMTLNSLAFNATDGVDDVMADTRSVAEVYTLSGICLGATDTDTLAPGLYVLRYDNGEYAKFLK